MQQKKNKWRRYLVLLVWVLAVQFVLINISAALYAYKFTHFYTYTEPQLPPKNIFSKTWTLFTGPRIYKRVDEKTPAFPFEQVKLSVDGGIQIDAWYGSVDQAKGCVIFFHGITVNKSTLLNEAEQMHTWGYNVLLVDFRGHGRSDGKRSSFGVKETIEVEKAFRFAESKGAKKIILYGASMGSVVILKAIAEQGLKPAAVIADMPFNGLRDHLKSRAKMLGFPSEPFASLVTFWIGVENGYDGFDHVTADYAAKTTCPVLLQWGDRDYFVAKKEIEAVYKRLPSTQKRLAIYQGVDHVSLFKHQPATWTAEVSSFLTSVQ